MTEAGKALEDIRMLTVNEVANCLKISKMTVYRLLKSGELEAVRVGRSFRVREQALLAYIHRGKQS